MNNYYMLMICFCFTGCSMLNSKDKSKDIADHDTYVTSVIQKQRSHMLKIYNKLSAADIKNIKKLARELVHENVGKVVLTPIVPNLDNRNVYKQVLYDMKNIFMRAGVSNFEIYIKSPKIDHMQSGIKIDSYSYKAVLPTAKKWKYPIGDIDESKTLPNLGVAYEYNFGAMIANPKDLVDPSPLDNMDAKSAIKPVRKIIPIATGSKGGGNNTGGIIPGGK